MAYKALFQAKRCFCWTACSRAANDKVAVANGRRQAFSVDRGQFVFEQFRHRLGFFPLFLSHESLCLLRVISSRSYLSSDSNNCIHHSYIYPFVRSTIPRPSNFSVVSLLACIGLSQICSPDTEGEKVIGEGRGWHWTLSRPMKHAALLHGFRFLISLSRPPHRSKGQKD